MASENQTISTKSRPLAHFHPNIWGTRFLHYTPDQSNLAGEQQLVEELKEEVKRELKEASNDYMRQLQLVDAIQRLGVAYHFEDEIDQALKNLYETFHDYCKNNHDLYTNALSFRLLRQHGYRVSCEVFDKFKDSKGDFSVPITAEEVAGVLEFFEATHLRIHGEDVLDHGFVLSRNHLQSALPSLSGPLADQVHYALNQYSNRRGLTRLNAKHYISIYHQFGSHHETLLKLAKLDFNLLQSFHRTELSELSRWWESLDVPGNLGYGRDRMVETYFWTSGVYFEPKYSFARKTLTRFQCMVSMIDDTYDAYATFEELEIFTRAIETWSLTCLDQLPDYMKLLYKTLLGIFEEIEEEIVRQGRSYCISYGIEAIKSLVRCYFIEANWLKAKYTPKIEEYMRVAVPSCGYYCLVLLSFLGMEQVATKEAFDWLLTVPAIVKGASMVCRLTDDIVGHQFDRKREHVPSSIECYIEEHKATREEAVKEFNNQLESAWKDINEGFLIRPTNIPVPLLDRNLNYARTIEVIYSKGDWYTHVGPEMQNFIMQLLVDPVPQ